MAWGNPAYLHKYWDNIDLTSYYSENFGHISYEVGSSETIKTAIKALHSSHNNAIFENKNIVLANGATQLISALIQIYNIPVYVDKPCFSRYKDISNLHKVEFLNKPIENSLQFIAIPNNPDGTMFDIPRTSNIVYDLSYNWKQYVPIIEAFDEDIMLFSLSKATGHASTRIGWGIIKDKKLAKELEHFIEIDTAGISMESQKLFLAIVNHEMEKSFTVFDYAQIVLAERWDKIKKIENKLGFKVLNNKGMFLWALGKPPENIKCMTGSFFGVSDDFFRLNIGCKEETFLKFIRLYNE